MADPVLRAAFNRPFEEQVAAFRLRLGNRIGTVAWDDLREEQHDRALVVAGAMKADLLADLGMALDRSIADGETIETFCRDFRAAVTKHGWHGWTGEGSIKGEAWRTRVIYKTNISTSYAAGRYAQLKAAGFEFWVYRHSGAEHPRLDHLSWDRVVLEADHPFWKQHYPPNGWGCGCRVAGARSAEGARRVGGNPDKSLPANWDTVDAKTGEPVGIGKGWGYAPGASVERTVQLGADILRRLPAEIGTHYGETLKPLIDRAWPIWVADTLARGSHQPGLAGTIGPDVVTALAALGRAPASAEIMIKPGLLVGPKATRHEDKGDALALQDWIELPRRLRAPGAVLLDRPTGNLLYLLEGEDRVPQLACRVDFRIHHRGDTSVTNQVVSAYLKNLTDIENRLNGGTLEILTGGL